MSFQLTQSRNLYHTPANGRNHGLPLYKPIGAPGNGMPTNGFSGLPPDISSLSSGLISGHGDAVSRVAEGVIHAVDLAAWA